MLGAAENGRYEVFEDVFVFAIRIGIDERKWKCLMNKKVINFLEERYRNRLGTMGFFNLLLLVILPSFMKFFTGIIFYLQDKLGIAIIKKKK